MLTVEVVPFDHPEAAELRVAQRVELDALYGTDDHEPGPPPTAADVPVFLIARDARGVAVGCGGLRPLGDDVAEIKRMYVRPPARGRGVARRVLAALESAAFERGWRRVRLETGAPQVAAVALYTSAGYRPIDRYGPYVDEPASLCFERVLD